MIAIHAGSITVGLIRIVVTPIDERGTTVYQQKPSRQAQRQRSHRNSLATTGGGNNAFGFSFNNKPESDISEF